MGPQSGCTVQSTARQIRSPETAVHTNGEGGGSPETKAHFPKNLGHIAMPKICHTWRAMSWHNTTTKHRSSSVLRFTREAEGDRARRSIARRSIARRPCRHQGARARARASARGESRAARRRATVARASSRSPRSRRRRSRSGGKQAAAMSPDRRSWTLLTTMALPLPTSGDGVRSDRHQEAVAKKEQAERQKQEAVAKQQQAEAMKQQAASRGNEAGDKGEQAGGRGAEA